MESTVLNQEIHWKDANLERPAVSKNYLVVIDACYLMYLFYNVKLGKFNCHFEEEDHEIKVQYWADIEGFPYNEYNGR